MGVERIINDIRNSDLSADECIAVFNTLREEAAGQIIGGKLWTVNDIDHVLEKQNWEIDDVDYEYIKNNIKTDIFNDATDYEWQAIEDAINKSYAIEKDGDNYSYSEAAINNESVTRRRHGR